MRRSNSVYSYLKFLSSALCLLILVSACEKRNSERTTTQRDATGKGNGGSGIGTSQAEIDRVFANLKPKLKLTFEALGYLVRAEKASPKSTELAALPGLQKTLALMTDAQASNVFTDVDTADNLSLQEAPCRDFRGTSKAAAAVLLEVGGKICFSSKMIRAASVKNFDKAAEIFIVALAAHEFTHHFISTGDHVKDEKLAVEVQNFVEQQLIRRLEVSAKDVISIDDSDYIARFYQYALDIFTSAVEQPGRGE